MPIQSITKEEKLEVLVKDSRDFIDNNKKRYEDYVHVFGPTVVYGDIYLLFDVVSEQMLSAQVVLEGVKGRDSEKLDRLESIAQTIEGARLLALRWKKIYDDWDFEYGDNAYEALATRPWKP
jgi:hypothetical protein